MSVVVVIPPEPIVTPPEAKLWAPALAGDDDGRLTALLAVAQAVIEPTAWLGSALGKQTLEVRWPAWPRPWGLLPYGPVIGIVEAGYVDPDGEAQTLDEAVYELIGAGSNSANFALRHGQSWPQAGCAGDAIRIRYEAGHEVNDPRLLPAKHAIVLSALQLRSLSTSDLALRSVEVPGVATKTYVVSDAARNLIKATMEDLLAPYWTPRL